MKSPLRISLGFLLVAGLLSAVLATESRAQLFASAGYYDGYNGDGLLVTRATTPAESYARGRADLIRSRALANVYDAEAAVIANQAFEKYLDNRKKFQSTYYDLRMANRDYRAAERGPRPSREDLERYARISRPPRLSPSELDELTGEPNWPILLRSRAFEDRRSQLEELFDRRAVQRRLDAEDYLRVRELTAQLKNALKDQIRELPPEEYVMAQRFLDGLAYEAKVPVAYSRQLAQSN